MERAPSLGQRTMGDDVVLKFDLGGWCAGNAVDENRSQRDDRCVRRDITIDRCRGLVRQLHYGLRHCRVPCMASLANLVGTSLGMPVDGNVEPEGAHGDCKYNGEKTAASLRQHRSLS
jgi:hypothetical protein